MLPRTLESAVKRAMKTFPAVLITGPRQSGKTTLLSERFAGTHRLVSLENPDVRARVREDPIGFLKTNPASGYDIKKLTDPIRNRIHTADNDRALNIFCI